MENKQKIGQIDFGVMNPQEALEILETNTRGFRKSTRLVAYGRNEIAQTKELIAARK